MSKGIVVGDVHVHPDYDLKRLKALGEFCAEQQPDWIAFIGDWADMPSINDHASKLEMEGSRYTHDCAVSKEGLYEFFEPIRARKKKMPYRFLTLGNHEVRISRFVSQNPKFHGLMSIEDLGFQDFGFKVIPFLQYHNHEGFRFVHYMQGKSGRPVELSTNFKKRGVSVVQGHSHTAQHYREYFEGRRIHGIDLGCFIHKDMGDQESWSNPTCHTYWRGVWVFDNCKGDGDADFTQVRAETLGV
jgi:hypothetical protein